MTNLKTETIEDRVVRKETLRKLLETDRICCGHADFADCKTRGTNLTTNKNKFSDKVQISVSLDDLTLIVFIILILDFGIIIK